MADYRLTSNPERVDAPFSVEQNVDGEWTRIALFSRPDHAKDHFDACLEQAHYEPKSTTSKTPRKFLWFKF